MTQCFVVATAPRQEQQASENLARQGYSVFLPRLKRTIRHARRTGTVLEALFPGYLFIKFAQRTTHWRSNNGTYGVRSLLMNGDRPAAVPVGFCERLQKNADAAGTLEPPPPDLKIRVQVQFTSGPFAGQTALIIGIKPRERVELLLASLSLEVRVGAILRQLSLAN